MPEQVPSNTLLPCPFCGGAAEVREASGSFFVQCAEVVPGRLPHRRCFAAMGENYDRDAMPEHMYSTAEDASFAWNQRASAHEPRPIHIDAKVIGDLIALTQFAYERGFHELGYDPVKIIADASLQPPAELLEHASATDEAITLLIRYRDSLTECHCEPCPQCQRMPRECDGTECAATCDCRECNYCRTVTLLAQLCSAQPPPADQLLDVHAICDERDRLRTELATLRLKHDGLADAVLRDVMSLPDEGFVSCPKSDLVDAITKALGPSRSRLPTPINHDLWRHMHDEHGLTLLQSELDEILRHAQPRRAVHGPCPHCGTKWVNAELSSTATKEGNANAR